MSKKFIDYINKPNDIIESKAFNLASYGLKVIILLVIAVMGVAISGFKYNTFNDILNIAYWLTVGVTLFEQLYSNDASYRYGLFFFKSANEDYKKNNEKSNMIVRGVKNKKDNNWLLKPLTDSSNVETGKLALKKLNEIDKLNHVKNQCKKLIGFFENKKTHMELSKKKRFLFPRIIKWVPFFKKEKYIKYCELRIKEGEELKGNDERILRIPSKNIKGYNELEWEDLVTFQEDYNKSKDNTSDHYMHSRKKARAKSVGKKFITKMIISTLGVGVLFGAIQSIDTKTLWTMIILIIIQGAYGFKEARNHVLNIVVINSSRRADALQWVYNEKDKIALELEKEKEEKAKRELKEKENEIIYQNDIKGGILPSISMENRTIN